jgi:hypothetical protein
MCKIRLKSRKIRQNNVTKSTYSALYPCMEHTIMCIRYAESITYFGVFRTSAVNMRIDVDKWCTLYKHTDTHGIENHTRTYIRIRKAAKSHFECLPSPWPCSTQSQSHHDKPFLGGLVPLSYTTLGWCNSSSPIMSSTHTHRHAWATRGHTAGHSHDARIKICPRLRL